MNSDLVFERVNGLGEVRYQPRSDTGQGLVVDTDSRWPKLYRSRARAERVARRYQKRELGNSWEVVTR